MLVLTGVLACSAVLLGIVLLAARLAASSGSGSRAKQGTESSLPTAPGPKAYPVIGNLHILGQYNNPFVAFTALSKIYGDIYSLVLGTVPCVVVNNYELIKEVLITKGSHFGGRPDFLRYHRLFGGDRNNSLALCDWSDLQKTRRQVARMYLTPRLYSSHFETLARVADAEVGYFLDRLASMLMLMPPAKPDAVNVKPLIQAACANMFSGYMCSTRFQYDDPAFRHVVRLFDEIFWEINQGYALDFLPWLAPAYHRHLGKLSSWSQEIRSFILERIIDEHRLDVVESDDVSERCPRDFTEALLLQLQEDPHLTWQHIIFELEDFLGGHSAVGNLTMLTLAAAAQHPEVAARIQAEVDAVTGRSRPVSMVDKPDMPYTEATLLETLRMSSSPIVPHVATQTSSIAGYHVERGTVVFINNHELNTGEAYWEEPARFRPERFLQRGKDGLERVVKPAFFIPFGTGKRTCIGQRLVHNGCFALVAATLQRYNVSTVPEQPVVTYTACVALPPDTFPLAFTPRARDALPLPLPLPVPVPA